MRAGRRRATFRLSAREVVAIGEPFRAAAGEYSDPGVALDEVLSLRASQEPLVLRVEASGGSSKDRRRVAGDWLCDPGAEPKMVPDASAGLAWRHSRASAEWASGRRWLDAWEGCSDGAWLAYAAAEVGAPTASLVAALRECAGDAVAASGADDARLARALEVLSGFASGSASALDLQSADASARAARTSVGPAAWHASSAVVYSLEFALVRASTLARAPHLASVAVESAAAAMPLGYVVRAAGVVRSHVATRDVLDGAASSWR